MAENEKKLKMSEAFEPEFIEKMKNILIEEKDRLEKELLRLGKPVEHQDENGLDVEASYIDEGREEDDNVREIENYTVNKALEITLEKSLRDVISALKRIDEDTYGICKYTGTAISTKRLEARPTSSSSVEAKKILTQES